MIANWNEIWETKPIAAYYQANKMFSLFFKFRRIKCGHRILKDEFKMKY